MCFPSVTISLLPESFSVICRIPPNQSSTFIIIFLRTEATVLPQMAKLWRSKFVVAQRKKPSTMQTVFPVRIAPSHMMASYFFSSGLFHQVIARSWRLLKLWYIIGIHILSGGCQDLLHQVVLVAGVGIQLSIAQACILAQRI